MIAAADTPLTIAGFVALLSLGLGAIGIAINATSKNNDLRDRLTRLEQTLEDHLRWHNGRGRDDVHQR